MSAADADLWLILLIFSKIGRRVRSSYLRSVIGHIAVVGGALRERECAQILNEGQLRAAAEGIFADRLQRGGQLQRLHGAVLECRATNGFQMIAKIEPHEASAAVERLKINGFELCFLEIDHRKACALVEGVALDAF